MVEATVCHFLSLFLPSSIGKKIVVFLLIQVTLLIGHTTVNLV